MVGAAARDRVPALRGSDGCLRAADRKRSAHDTDDAALACRAFKLAGHDARFLFGEAVDPVVVTAQYCPLTAIIMPVRL